MRVFNKPILKICAAYSLAILTLFYVVGCRYFELKHGSAAEIVSLQNIGEIHKAFIVHTGGMIYELKEITVDSVAMYGALDVAKGHVYFSEGRDFRYESTETDILNEVHIYMREDIAVLDLGSVEIPLADISEIAIIEKDTGKTQASYIFGSIGIVAGVLAIITIIVALTKSSCPYVYVNDSDGFIFEGEIFGGAIAQNLERDDYMPLPSIQPVDGLYHIRISNELKERQYTDLAELIVVNHPKSQQVLLDKYGNPQTVGNPQFPVSTISLSGSDLNTTLREKDRDVFMFNEGVYTTDGVVLNFTMPPNTDKGKLVLNAKNTLWFDYMFGEFLSKFGMSFDNWMEKQSMVLPEERLQKMLDNDFQLSIYIKRDKKWQLIDYLHTVGPLASRDFVIPVDLNDIDEEEFQIKVETGFMFWELDYVSMSYDQYTSCQVNYVPPAAAMGTGSQNWTRALTHSDGHYMVQENIGEVTEVIYSIVPALINEEQSVFLHSKGYYELIRDFDGLPNLDELNKFKDNGYFSSFSRSEYLKVTKTEDGDIAGSDIRKDYGRTSK